MTAPESSAQSWVVVEDAEAEALWFGGSLLVTRADATMSAGTLSIVDFMARQRGFAPLHQAAQDQIFIVLDGQMQFAFGAERVTVAATASVVIPARTTFAHRVSSPEARYLLVTSPAGVERMFRTGGEPALARRLPAEDRPGPSPEVLASAAAAGGVSIMGPPPA